MSAAVDGRRRRRRCRRWLRGPKTNGASAAVRRADNVAIQPAPPPRVFTPDPRRAALQTIDSGREGNTVRADPGRGRETIAKFGRPIVDAIGHGPPGRTGRLGANSRPSGVPLDRATPPSGRVLSLRAAFEHLKDEPFPRSANRSPKWACEPESARTVNKIYPFATKNAIDHAIGPSAPADEGLLPPF